MLVATTLKLLLFPALSLKAPFAFFYAVVIASTWMGGIESGLFAIVLAGAAARYWFLPDSSRLLAFSMESLLLCLLTHNYRMGLVGSRAYLQRIFLDSPAGLLVATSELRIVRANPAMNRMLGVDSGSLDGAALADVLPASCRDRILAVFSNQNGGHGTVPAIQEVLLCREGVQRRWLDLTASRVTVPGQGEKWLLIGQDVTERRRSEQALQAGEERLRQAEKVEAIGLLASQIAHDFNNHLAVISGYCEDASKRVDAEGPLRSDIQEIARAAAKSTELTHRLLRFGRRESSKVLPVNCNSIVKEMTPFLRRLLGEGIRFETSLDPELLLVQADPVQIEQILLNLAANARDAMPEGGTLVVSTHNLEQVETELVRGVQIPRGRYATLVIADSGTGIDPAILGRVFEPFFTTKPADKGTGLGLATVKRVVRQLSGHVTVDSTPGAGTRLTIYLPVPPVSEPVLSGQKEKVGVEAATATVLLVDDEESLRKLAATILTDAGYRVLEASDGDGALASAAGHDGRLDLLITDLRMPGMQGPEIAKLLLKTRTDMRVLYISGDPTEANLGPGDALIEKPFTAQGLVEKVREVLSGGPSEL